jgi:disulfide bond formation protein DsbB
VDASVTIAGARYCHRRPLARLHTGGVDTETAQLFFGLLALAAGFGAISLIVLRIAAAAGNDGAARLGSSISEAGVWLAFLVAAGATLGSLYFSEVAGFNPCRLCWFQRIAMYPLAPILLVGALRRDPDVRWYAVPLAAIGAAISGWHTLIEWRPALDNGECSLTGPSCTFVWFRQFGFLTLASMALIGFLTVLILLLVRFPARLDPSSSAHEPASEPEMEPST